MEHNDFNSDGRIILPSYHELVREYVRRGFSRVEASFLAFRDINRLLPKEPKKQTEDHKKAKASIFHADYLTKKN